MNIPSEYLQWRLWVAIFLPTLLAFGTNYLFGETLLGTALALSFCLTVGACFTRYMARAQTLAEYRAEVLRLQAEFSEVTERVEKLPPDEQEAYAEPLYRMEFRLRVLESVLESRQ